MWPYALLSTKACLHSQFLTTTNVLVTMFFVFSRNSYKWSNNILWDLATFFHLTSCFTDSNMLLHVSVVIIFNCWKVFHYMDLPQIVYQFISQWMFGLFPVLSLIWIKHLWIFKDKTFCHHKVSFFLCKYLEAKLSSHLVSISLTL